MLRRAPNHTTARVATPLKIMRLWTGTSYGRIGGGARGLAGDAVLFTKLEQPARDYETVLELAYQLNVAPWWVLQPDLQLIFHPGGHTAANPSQHP